MRWYEDPVSVTAALVLVVSLVAWSALSYRTRAMETERREKLEAQLQRIEAVCREAVHAP